MKQQSSGSLAPHTLPPGNKHLLYITPRVSGKTSRNIDTVVSVSHDYRRRLREISGLGFENVEQPPDLTVPHHINVVKRLPC